MTDAHVAIQVQHVPGVEDITHQAFILAQVQTAAITRHDARGILTPMLQHGQTIIDRLVDRIKSDDSDDAAHSRYSVGTRGLSGNH